MCSFLVADKVYVASVPPATAANPNPKQFVFSSGSHESSFETFEDPRGNTLGRGTEITLVLKEDALEYLDTHKLSELVYVCAFVLISSLPNRCLQHKALVILDRLPDLPLDRV